MLLAGTALASDGDPASGSTGTPTDPARNAGPTAPEDSGVEVGDYVWQDLNYNGLQDANEPGVPGVLVTLYYGVGGVLNTTTTDADGLLPVHADQRRRCSWSSGNY